MIQRLGIGKFLLITMSLLAFTTLGLGLFAYVKTSSDVLKMSDITGEVSTTTLTAQRLLSSFASLHSKYTPLISENEIDVLERLGKEIDISYSDVDAVLKECGERCAGYSDL